MNTMRRSFAFSLVALFLMACGPKFVRIHNIQDQPIPHGLTQDQVKEAIVLGARIAGWSTNEVAPGKIIAAYYIRAHKITVVIHHSEAAYSIDYKSSVSMKIYCDEEDKDAGLGSKISTGEGTCPGGAQPALIHEKYREWVEELDRSIRVSLQEKAT